MCKDEEGYVWEGWWGGRYVRERGEGMGGRMVGRRRKKYVYGRCVGERVRVRVISCPETIPEPTRRGGSPRNPNRADPKC